MQTYGFANCKLATVRFCSPFDYRDPSLFADGMSVTQSCSATGSWAELLSSIFEQVCRDWAGRYSADPPLADAEEIGAYWTRTHDVEVDLIARDRKGVLAVGSCKWSERADSHDFDRLLELRGRIRGAGGAMPYVFARDFHPTLLRRAEREPVRLVSADELFSDAAHAA